MPDPAPLQLAVGERVVYPNQGVCRVVSIETKEVAGQRLNFVTLRREEDGAVVMVPESKVQSIGVRKVAGRSEAERVAGEPLGEELEQLGELGCVCGVDAGKGHW